jgi:catechol 2,3-dioxygenase-like lactoylglutathione lyase family enzyme
MRIQLASIFVADQEEARRFSTGVLGFAPRTDAPFGGTDAPFDDDCGDLVDLHQS